MFSWRRGPAPLIGADVERMLAAMAGKSALGWLVSPREAQTKYGDLRRYGGGHRRTALK